MNVEQLQTFLETPIGLAIAAGMVVALFGIGYARLRDRKPRAERAPSKNTLHRIRDREPATRKKHMESPEPIMVYRSLMEALKTRITCLRRLADGSLSIGDDRFNWELAALQLRKVLELVAFASLCAHRDVYAAAHANFAKHWNAARLLKDLASIHPDFYPQPVRFDHVKEGGIRHFARVDGYLTQDDFVRLYDVCSKVIHTPNPFGEVNPIDFGLSLVAWVERIQALLDTHYIRLHGMPQLWVVQMAAGSGGGVHIAVGEPRAV